MHKNRNFIFLTSADFDNPYRTNQHYIAEKLSVNHLVVFIESVGLRKPGINKKDIFRIFKRLNKSFKGINRVRQNLYIFSPLLIPFYKYEFFHLVNKILLEFYINYIVWKLKLNKYILYSFVPNVGELKFFVKPQMIIYHCVDEISGNPNIPQLRVEQMEKKTLKKADLVFTSSSPLFEAKRKFNLNTYYLPNVCETQHFQKALDDKTEIPDDIKNIPSPIIGFIGALSTYKIDFELINFVAKSFPVASLVLIGVLGEGEPPANISLLKEKNIYLLGGKDFCDLPKYLKKFDVCIIPAKINKYTSYMLPMKFFEYLASGKPVVSTNLISLKEFEKYVKIASTKEEFLRFIQESLKENSPQKIKERIEFAKKFSWTQRINQIESLINARKPDI